MYVVASAATGSPSARTVSLVTGLMVFCEDAVFVGFLLPGETVAILAGVASRLGHVPLPAVLVVVVAAPPPANLRTWTAALPAAGEYRIDVARMAPYCDPSFTYSLIVTLRTGKDKAVAEVPKAVPVPAGAK